RDLAEVCRPRLLDADSAEEEGCRELVMGREQSEWAVHDLRSLTLQAGELPKSRLDPVERTQDVQPRHSDVAFSEPRRCRLREPRALPMLGKGRGQGAIRLRRLSEDDDRAARTSAARPPSRRARVPFDRELDVCNCHDASSASATKPDLRLR